MKPLRTVDDLPRDVPVFPLAGALLLPRGALPLNVFEPRYLLMVDDVLSGEATHRDRQPSEPEEHTLTPALTSVGCIGRLTSFKETEDHRYQVTLTGSVASASEKSSACIRQSAGGADYSAFAGDLILEEDTELPRARLMAALKHYLSRRDLKADWQSVMQAPPEHLVNALAMLCPFEPNEKQALLEAPSWNERVATLVALLEMSDARSVSGSLN